MDAVEIESEETKKLLLFITLTLWGRKGDFLGIRRFSCVLTHFYLNMINKT